MSYSKRPLTYELDNTALIYQALISKSQNHFFRLSVNLLKPIVIDALQKALLNILPRFPIFRTTLKKGIFWNYLEENFYYPHIQKDEELTTNYNITKAHAYPFRVVAYAQKISLETSHLTVDGRSASHFLQSLLCEYAILIGINISKDHKIIRPTTPFKIEELSDAYKSLLLSSTLPKPKKYIGLAFREPNRNRYPIKLNLIQFRIPLDETLALAKHHGVSLTTLMTTFYLTAYQDRMFLLPPKHQYRRPLRINNPVDLRQFFPSKSLRNFIGFISHEIDPRLGLFSFQEILQQVHHTMKKELLDKHFQPFIGQNIRSESIPIIASIPLFIKRLILKKIYVQSMKQETSVLSNLGSFYLPTEVATIVKDVEFIPAPKYINKRDCSIISFNNTLTVSISRTCLANELEQLFYERLLEAGLNPKISTYHGYQND